MATTRAVSRSLLIAIATAVLMRRTCCAVDAPAPAANQTRPPALFVFGDSIVDSGNNNAITTLIRCNFPPYGQDFPGHNATGRFSNGRVPSDILGTHASRTRTRHPDQGVPLIETLSSFRCSQPAGHQGVLAGVPRHGTQRLRPPHRRQLRLRRLRLRPPHRRARGN